MNEKHYKRWSKEDDLQLRELVAEGATYRELSQELKRTEEGIGHRIKFLNIGRGITGKHPNLKLRSRILECLRDDITVLEVAQRLGISPSTCYDNVLKLFHLGLIERKKNAKFRGPKSHYVLKPEHLIAEPQ